MTAPLSLPPWPSPAEAGFSAAGLRRLHDALAALCDQGSLPGISVAVARHGRVVAVQHHGTRDAAGRMPVDDQTLFRWYSLTKPVTGIALALLQERGLWQLDDPLAAHLPPLADLQVHAGPGPDDGLRAGPAPRQPTLRDLLGHRAGFAYGIADPPPHPVDALYARQRLFDFDQPLSTLVARLALLPLAAPPGCEFRYSLSHDLMGAVIERLSGQSLGTFLRRALLQPLGMMDTGFHVPRQRHGDLAALWRHDGLAQAQPATAGALVWDVLAPPPLQSGGGGLVGSLADLLRFGDLLLRNPVVGDRPLLAPQTLALATTPLHHAVPGGGPGAPGIGYSAAGLYVLDQPAAIGSPVSPGTLNAAGAGGGFLDVDRSNGVVIAGLMSVLDWRAPQQPGQLAEDLVYDALSLP